MSESVDSAFIKALPKLELHIHLEGSIPMSRIEAEAEVRGVAPPRPFEQLFVTEDLTAFLETLDWVCSLFREPDQLHRLAWDFAEYCAGQGMQYCEVIVNPTHWEHFEAGELLHNLGEGFAAAAEICDVRVLPSILRTQSAEEALALVSAIETLKSSGGGERIVGLSVDGNESQSGPTGERFAPAYRKAAELGLGLTSHAGESSGSEGVREALDWLGVQRIDHGVRAIEDSAVVERLAEEGITLNVCVSSNCVRMYPGPAEHPFPKLMEAGVPVTVNTDDPVVLHTDLCEELAWLVEHYQLDRDQMLRLQQNAIDAAFCGSAEKANLSSRLNQFAAEFA